MSTQGLRSDHLDTGIPALNQMLDIKMDAVLDIQSVPMNPALWAIFANLITSHLSKPNTTVIIIETLNSFEWEWLQHHPQFQTTWLKEKRLLVYRLDSFAKLFSFFAFVPTEFTEQSSVFALVLNFHELIEMYRLQLAACYEETLLKHQIEKCNILLANKEQGLEEGFELIELPTLPKTSSLLRESPYSKFTKQLETLLLLINAFAYKRSSVVALQGFFEQKFKPYTQVLGERHSSQLSGTRNIDDLESDLKQARYPRKARLVFSPVSIGKENKAGEYKVSSRLLFYNDWYYNSPHFASENKLKERADYHIVSVVKVTNFHGFHSINDPIYFDFKQYPIRGTKPNLFDSWFINLLATKLSCDDSSDDEQENLSTVLQTSTQNFSRKRDYSSTQLAASLPLKASQELNYFMNFDEKDGNKSDHSDARSVEVDIDAYSFDKLIIEESDVELTGTVFDDQLHSDLDVVEESVWTLRHV